MSSYAILLIEDDHRLVEMLTAHFLRHDWISYSAKTKEEALESFFKYKPDLVILDRNLPDTDGVTICNVLRSEGCKAKILMLTGFTDELDVVEGLESGADDYVGKPFRLAELLARIKALLRRNELVSEKGLLNTESIDSLDCKSADRVSISLENRRVFVKGESVEFTAREFDLLVFMAKHPGRVFTRAQILRNVWDSETDVYEQSINTIIKRIRKKIEVDHNSQSLLETVRGIGYRFNGEGVSLK